MKRSKTKSRAFSLFVGFAAAFFAACDNDVVTRRPPDLVTVEALSTTVFYSLGEKRVVGPDEIASKAWDIAFPRPVSGSNLHGGPVRVLWTNSGSTAERLAAGGQGGSWFAGTNNFDDITTPEQRVESYQKSGTPLPHHDHFVWMRNMINQGGQAVLGDPPAVKRESSNVMNYLGWRDGNGTESDGYFFLQYNARQWFKMVVEGGAAKFIMTNNVYIIRHANGERYSAIQFIDYRTAADPVTERFTFLVRNF